VSYEITPVLDNLDLDFNPDGRSNSDKDYDILKNNVIGKEKAYTWELSENFDWINGGWRSDETGSYFCIKAGTYVDFNYYLFNDEYTVFGPNKTLGNGKEFKIIFKTTNVAKTDATWLECVSEASNTSNTGLKMDVHHGYVYSNNNNLTIPYSEEDIIEFDLNITPGK
jgi:hypothetical protein